MSSANISKSLKAIVKSKVNDNPVFNNKKDKLIENIVHAITNERIINVNGAAGTGKTSLINNIIVPQFEKDNSVHRFKSNNIPSDELDSIIDDPDNKIAISILETRIHIVDFNSQTQASNVIQNILDDSYEIHLKSIQERFLEYPKIIEKIANDIHNVTMDQIQVSFVGYLESLISGIRSNILGLRKIIKSENITEWREALELYDPSIKFMFTFSSYLDEKRSREKLWDSIYTGGRAIDLTKIYNFNKKFKSSWGMAIADSGLSPGRKQSDAKALERTANYCKAIINKFNDNKLDSETLKIILKPLNDNIDNLDSGKYKIEKKLRDVYIFKKKIKIEHSKSINFSQDDDYHSIKLNGELFHLTDTQAEVLKFIYEKYSDGTEFRGSIVLRNLHKNVMSMYPVFKTRPEFRDKFLICTNPKLGMYKIHPDFCDPSS